MVEGHMGATRVSNESFNGTLPRECIDAKQFRSVTKVRVMIEAWRQYYNQHRPHSVLGYQTPMTAYWGQPS
jgi:putative transposase